MFSLFTEWYDKFSCFTGIKIFRLTRTCIKRDIPQHLYEIETSSETRPFQSTGPVRKQGAGKSP